MLSVYLVVFSSVVVAVLIPTVKNQYSNNDATEYYKTDNIPH
jgi:hypothetical protein